MLTVFQFIIFKEAKTRPTATERCCQLYGRKSDESCQEVNPIRAVVAQAFCLTEKLSAECIFVYFASFIYQTNDLETQPRQQGKK